MSEAQKWIDKLDAITTKLPDLVLEEYGKEIEWRDGVKGISLKAKKCIGVVDSFLPKGSKLDWHSHDSIEIIIVYQGGITFELEEKSLCHAKVGSVIKFKSGEKHRVLEIKENTKCIGITIPKDAGYPNG